MWGGDGAVIPKELNYLPKRVSWITAALWVYRVGCASLDVKFRQEIKWSKRLREAHGRIWKWGNRA